MAECWSSAVLRKSQSSRRKPRSQCDQADDVRLQSGSRRLVAGRKCSRCYDGCVAGDRVLQTRLGEGTGSAWVAQLVERVLGKDEVTGSIPVPGSRILSLDALGQEKDLESSGGGNSTVESHSSKVMVAGSNPVPRSRGFGDPERVSVRSDAEGKEHGQGEI
jgi:hypothetical protein